MARWSSSVLLGLSCCHRALFAHRVEFAQWDAPHFACDLHSCGLSDGLLFQHALLPGVDELSTCFSSLDSRNDDFMWHRTIFFLLVSIFFSDICTSASNFIKGVIKDTKNRHEELMLCVFRSSWRISKSYSRCCSSSSCCGLFCFTAYSFHRNFLKLGVYM